MWQASQASSTVQEPGATSQVVTREFRSEASTSFMGRVPDKSWFADNESEASYK